MTKEQPTTRETAERLVRADPTISAAEIARQTGVSRERVRFLLDELGYELRQEWRRKKVKPGK